jgi:ABC-type sulfate/molybdate transport systems ATPase subunit
MLQIAVARAVDLIGDQRCLIAKNGLPLVQDPTLVKGQNGVRLVKAGKHTRLRVGGKGARINGRIVGWEGSAQDGAVLAAGTAVFDGVDMLEEPLRHRRHLGWLGEAAPADGDLTVKAYLKYRAKLKGEQSRKIRHRVREAMSICGVADIGEALIGNLSRGQRKRVALADAVLLRPRLLLLDDVFAGLDDVSREAVVSMMSSFKVFATVIVSGHERDWFERAGARILELKGGKVS